METDARPSPYLMQLARARRFLHRVEHRDAPTTEAAILGIAHYEDDLWAFFQNCWHIKDWLRADDTIPEATRRAVVKAAEASAPLKACGDLANGNKHFGRPRGRVAAEILDLQLSPDVGTGVHWDHYVTLDNNSRITAYQLGREAMLAWKNILGAHGLALCPGWVDP